MLMTHTHMCVWHFCVCVCVSVCICAPSGKEVCWKGFILILMGEPLQASNTQTFSVFPDLVINLRPEL